MSDKIDAINLWELEGARELLSQMGYDYYASGANDEVTLRGIERPMSESRCFLPRMLVDVSVRDMSTTVLGEPVSMPILIAPVALPGLAHPEGEIATVKAASAAKTQKWQATGKSLFDDVFNARCK